MKVPELLKFPLEIRRKYTNSLEVYGSDGRLVFEFHSKGDDMEHKENQAAEWIVKALNAWELQV